MLHSEKYNFIFIHIPKNAGTSITRALRPYAKPGRFHRWVGRNLRRVGVDYQKPRQFPDHITANKLIMELGEEQFKKYFVFAVVRNPWERMASLYQYTRNTPAHINHEVVNSMSGFEEYVIWSRHRSKPQKHFIYSEDNRLLVDYLARYETLQQDFERVCEKLGFNVRLPKLNSSQYKPWRDFYTDKTAEIVSEIFKEDIQTFEYEF